MASVPSGMISFLYHVMHDTEMNYKFRYESDEVMEFFELTDEQRQLIIDSGITLKTRKIEKETAFEVRKKRAEKKMEEAAEQVGTKGIPPDLVEAQKEALPKEGDLLAAKDIATIATDVFRKHEARIQKQLLEAVRQELEKGFGRFW